MAFAPSRCRLAPNAPPGDRPSRLDPDRPLPDLWALMDAVLDQFGFSDAPTRSKRHGHQPKAREHAKAYLMRHAFGLSFRQVARSTGQSLGTVHVSVRKGRALIHGAAAERGFIDPLGVRFIRDPDEETGYRAADADPWHVELPFDSDRDAGDAGNDGRRIWLLKNGLL